MPTYTAPGVYVEIVTTAPPIQPAGTSTAGFIGVVPDDVTMPASTAGVPLQLTSVVLAQLKKDGVPDAVITTITALTKSFNSQADFLAALRPLFIPTSPANAPPSADYAKYKNKIVARAMPQTPLQAANVPLLVTSFNQFVNNFGEPQAENSLLAHAVYGFFLNGGTVCYVARTTDTTKTVVTGPKPASSAAPTQPVPSGTTLGAVLSAFEGIVDISLVAVPGIQDVNDCNQVIDHCQKMQYRFAVLDGMFGTSNDPTQITNVPQSSDNNFAALYYPWIVIPNLDADTSDTVPTINQPPSGHVCGLIARVDQQTGPYYAPANEIVRGTAQLAVNLTKSDQQVLNPLGINLIRNFRGAITLWGARTLADPAGNTGQFLYVSVQRTMSFLAQSIDEGSQFVVFKPNSQKLWGQVKRVVTAFLTDQWRDGALFGSKPEDAFFVTVDESNNPPELRALGILIIEIGVSIVLPAEFVVFRIQQYTQIPTS